VENNRKTKIDNSTYWNEPCGIVQADRMNLSTQNIEDLEKYDKWYLNFYPYLPEYLSKLDLKDKVCLEIGIGMGTISRLLRENVRQLDLVDIAPQPLQLAERTFKDTRNVRYFETSIFDFKPDNKYDCIVAIGSLHHTGDFKLAIERTEKLLKPGGKILVMAYYAFQPRRLVLKPFDSLKKFLQTKSGTSYVFYEKSWFLRKRLDQNRAGEGPPSTELISRNFFKNREGFDYATELNNVHGFPFIRKSFGRKLLLKLFSRKFGCNVYALGIKNISIPNN
jgi:2-polyprenyl-3-methyl-5-hydroxy-6-metoxy-1,4-benzoquinol methylase